MVSAPDIYACGLTLLGVWGSYSARKSIKLARGWSRRRWLTVLVESLFVVSCLGCAAMLWIGRFRPWMAASIGACYLLMIPLPCYFDLVNRVRWIHAIRNLLFLLVALFSFSIAAGLIPAALLGLP